MDYYITPTKKGLDSGIYILHVGTNDLTLDDTPQEITEHIVNIATSLRTKNNSCDFKYRTTWRQQKRKGGSS